MSKPELIKPEDVTISYVMERLRHAIESVRPIVDSNHDVSEQEKMEAMDELTATYGWLRILQLNRRKRRSTAKQIINKIDEILSIVGD